MKREREREIRYIKIIYDIYIYVCAQKIQIMYPYNYNRPPDTYKRHTHNIIKNIEEKDKKICT